uniref:TIGR03960 family B12-binding radical SAM protein n=1 Tax=Vaginimicrobium propionicum TaxID=1871034 RepID=UPI0009705937|nr:TIGR03960 family B12-binding radical SAM protein [Vaginimicrobium propionicum]
MSASIWPQLERALNLVQAPVQYVGGELNSVNKPWESVDVRWVLMYPDTYAVGQPNQGLAILYEVLNEIDWVSAERTYAVAPDLGVLMRERGIPQFSWESHRPIKDFDVIGITLQTELGYTNVLETLDLAAIALHSKDRELGQPFVLAGGHCGFNPEPLADFLDAVSMGDGEEAVQEFSQLVRDWKQAGCPDGRDGLLLAAAKTGHFYIPRFYDVTYQGADGIVPGAIERISPNRQGVPYSVRKWVLTDLDDWPYPKAPLVPVAETVHERYSVEIFRGCTRGCRFCQAGMITRPVRERSLQTIGQMIDKGLHATGMEEVGLLSLSSADHSEIESMAHQLADRYESSEISLSIPSTRVDAFNIDLAQELSRSGRRSGLTFAPEGGSERMRAIINKNVSEQDLLATVTAAFSRGWRQVKLYFMCGLPGETDEDVAQIARMAHDVIVAGRAAAGHRDIRCTISIGAFVPKPHTPFQWFAQVDPETVNARLKMLKDLVRSDRQAGRAISVRYADGRPSLIEGLLARGDRRVGKVIEAVWRAGGKFDGWSEHFDYELWLAKAREQLEPLGLSLAWFTMRERDELEVLPWDHLDAGLDRQWLWNDYEAAMQKETVPDCRWEDCNDCGVCPGLGVDLDFGATGLTLLPLTSVKRKVS